MRFDYALIENELEESLGKDIAKAAAGIGLVIALLAGHKADLKSLDDAQRVIKTELSQEIKDLIPDDPSKQSRQRASQEWSRIIQQAAKENPQLAEVPSLYRAGVAIINNPSLLNKRR